jgi:flagellar biosynthesis chaperone FliJ
VAEYLQSCSKKIGSRYLAFVANRVTEDPFGKVKKMIKDLIVKLMEEANAEADHKGYCDTELATNKQTREIKTAEVDNLAARIEKNMADIAQLSQGITTLSDEITEVTQQQAEANKLRVVEKATNVETIVDAKEAQAAVERALRILKDFYTSDHTALLQKSQAKAPYSGMAASGGNIIDFLDVILSNFARLESETSTDDDQQAAAHERFMNDSNEDKAVKTSAMKHKTRQRDQT